jgi:uncharacterized protein DUF3303
VKYMVIERFRRGDDAGLFDQWTTRWNDLVEFDIVPAIGSREAGTRAFTKASDPEQRDQV